MKTLSYLSFLTFMIACQPVNHHAKKETGGNKLQQIKWIIGKWKMQTPQGIITEEWSNPSDSQWQGVSYMIAVAGDTPFIENIRLGYQQDGRLCYKPAVLGQNEGKEVSFAEKSFSDSLVIFENINHDFPQRIIYKRVSDTSILAAIEGIQNGQSKREEFAYTKE